MESLSLPLGVTVLAVSDPPVSLYRYYITGTGPVLGGLFFVLGAVTLVFIMVQLITWLALPVIPRAVAEAIRERIDKGQMETLPTLCQANPSLFGRVLEAGLTRLPLGLEAARLAAGLKLDLLLRDREFGLHWLRIIVVAAPLLRIIAASWEVSAALITMENRSSPKGPHPENLPYVVGRRLSPLMPAAIISLFAGVAVAVLSRLRDGVALRVRADVENTLMAICQRTATSCNGAIPSVTAFRATPER